MPTYISGVRTDVGEHDVGPALVSVAPVGHAQLHRCDFPENPPANVEKFGANLGDP